MSGVVFGCSEVRTVLRRSCLWVLRPAGVRASVGFGRPHQRLAKEGQRVGIDARVRRRPENGVRCTSAVPSSGATAMSTAYTSRVLYHLVGRKSPNSDEQNFDETGVRVDFLELLRCKARSSEARRPSEIVPRAISNDQTSPGPLSGKIRSIKEFFPHEDNCDPGH